jgi:hypothetical protein
MSDLLPINATMIVGILIFYTIPTITKGEWLMNRFDKVVIYTVAGAVILFAISAIATIIPVVDISEWCTVGGFIAIIIMVLAFTQVISMAKIASLLTELSWGPEPSGKKKEKVEHATLQTQDNVKEIAKEEEQESGKVYPEPWKDKTQDEVREEEARRKQEEELQKKKARMEPSEGYHTMWPDQPIEESSDKSHVDDAVGD